MPRRTPALKPVAAPVKPGNWKPFTLPSQTAPDPAKPLGNLTKPPAAKVPQELVDLVLRNVPTNDE